MEIKEIAELYNQNQKLKSFVRFFYNYYNNLSFEPYFDDRRLGNKVHEFLQTWDLVDIEYIDFGKRAKWKPNSKFYNLIKEE